ncbi:hypothetical protein BX666DRAFT_217566 [Dichotomocladium elegans]|nr:hypothetical protein BX666DRAFT_217566 [Dichotomocladium elegans]
MHQHYYHPYATQAFPMFDPSAALYYRSNACTAAVDFQQQLAPHYGVHSHYQENIHHLHERQQTAGYPQRQTGAMLSNNAQQLMGMLPPFANYNYATVPSQMKSNRIQTKAQRRAEHNATERLRRENLNNQFQQLANTLPNLENDRRPSKGRIIERTLDFVKLTAAKEQEMLCEINNLRAEQDALRRQLEQDFPTDQDSDDSSDGSFSPVESHLQRPSSSVDSCPSLELPSATLNFFSEEQDSMFNSPTGHTSAMYSSLDGLVDPFAISHHIPYESDDDSYSNATPSEMDFAALPMAMPGRSLVASSLGYFTLISYLHITTSFIAPNAYPSTTQSDFAFPLYQQ